LLGFLALGAFARSFALDPDALLLGFAFTPNTLLFGVVLCPGSVALLVTNPMLARVGSKQKIFHV